MNSSSFPLRHIHLPSPLQRSFPSPPASRDADIVPPSPSIAARISAASDGQNDTSFFPTIAAGSTKSDSRATLALASPPSRMSLDVVALAWAVLRLRHPILASIGLMDPFGKVSYSYEPPLDVDAALLEAKSSIDLRRNQTPSDLLASHETGSRRVSRSHLSHLFFASAPTSAFLSPPPSPSNKRRNTLSTPTQFSFLLTTPHYVADNDTLRGFLEELRIMLEQNNEPGLRQILEDELKVAASQQPSPTKIPFILSPKIPQKSRFVRSG